ncbi:MAG: twin-arginine translocase subunit TatC [Chlorobi bacterium]|nr:MAG: twin-arginine translocase subunit TatC [Bacteroidota bacterium]MBE2264666.1 twin-arginine translocase subunit TatC [Flavobacteriales bacterium]MBL1161629.1 twin-arginine translocase subunit TatC [Chlorobiota bacterium]MBW7852745.1 twin-arginine translocase subunit TatC [Candidatus Kapabacteria bacterium]MCC6332326.1 twin-arginine translocase subunit TatC [Ignavibacteria bacterium]
MAEQDNEKSGSEMSFLGHLDELRRRLFRALLWLIAGTAIAGFFHEWIMNVALLGPAVRSGIHLQNLQPFGQAFLLFKVVFFAGLILSFPFIAWQVWGFVAPGLYAHERKWARWVTALTTLCFLLGVAFGYFALIPSMMDYIHAMQNPNIEDNIAVNDYFSFFVNMMLASGLIFELPMVTWVVSRIGLISDKVMTKYRRHAIVGILVIAAIITPTPDPITQLMVAIPLYILYEISVVIARFNYRKRQEADA